MSFPPYPISAWSATASDSINSLLTSFHSSSITSTVLFNTFFPIFLCIYISLRRWGLDRFEPRRHTRALWRLKVYAREGWG